MLWMVNLERQASALSLPAMASPNLHLPCGCLAQDLHLRTYLGLVGRERELLDARDRWQRGGGEECGDVDL